MKRIRSFLMIVFILGLQLGCSGSLTIKEQNLASSMDAVDIEVSKLMIPFTQHIYSKRAADFTWEDGSTEGIQQDIIDNYKRSEPFAPGGFMVGETPTAYFICVSMGGIDSITEGFEIRSVYLPDDGHDRDPILYINAKRVSNEVTGVSGMNEAVYVTALVSFLKEDIPDNIIINETILQLEE
ncbi:MAG TPA: hypothetical protein IAA29_18360 [Candidatus Paenibacillus intestinavium]|nr:hypothetical protein [Candidatus Paenibacillus intestinavium]